MGNEESGTCDLLVLFMKPAFSPMIGTMSNPFPPLMLAAMMAASCWSVGAPLWRRLAPASVPLTPVYATGLGAGALSIVLAILGALHLYSRTAALLLLLPGVAGRFTALRRKPKARWPRLSRWELAWGAVGAVALLTSLLAALAPPTAKDALIYHLVVPRHYVEEGGFVDLPYNVWSYVPMHTEMLYTWGLLLGRETIPALIHWLYGLGALFVTWILARRMGASSGVAVMAAALLATVPKFWWLMGSPYSDLPMAFYAALCFDLFLRWKESRESRWLILAGVFLGMATASRYQGLILWPVFLLGVLLEVKNESAGDVLAKIGPAVCLSFTAAVLVMLPWWIRNGVWTHNPLFPYFIHQFPTRSPGWDEMRQSLSLQILHRYGGIHKTLLDYVLLPFRLAFQGAEDDPARFDGLIGPGLLLGVLPILSWRRLSARAQWGIGFCCLYALFWVFSSQQARWLLHVGPVFAAVIASSFPGAERMDHRAHSTLRFGSRPVRDRGLGNPGPIEWRVALAAVVLCAAWNLWCVFGQFMESGQSAVLAGQMSRDDYLSQRSSTYDAVRFLNEHTPAAAGVLMIDVGSSTYYLQHPEFHDTQFEDWTISHVAADSASADEIAARLRAMGIAYLLLAPDILFGQETSPFIDSGDRMADAGKRLRDCLDRCTTTVFTAPNGLEVRELRKE